MPNHPNRKPRAGYLVWADDAPSRPTRDGWDLHTISPQGLRDLIAHAGITQAEAARRCHASERTLRQWLAGDRAMPISASECLALSLMWPGESRRVQPTVALCERWLRPQFAGLIVSM